MAGLLLVNHVLSAIDAARVARARNQGQEEAAIARRILLHVSGIDGARDNGLARLRRWLADQPPRDAGA